MPPTRSRTKPRSCSWRSGHSLVGRALGTATLMLMLLMTAPPAEAQFIQQDLKLPGGSSAAPSHQGWSVGVSADGNTAVVGGPNDNSSAGAVWVWARSGGSWNPGGGGTKLVGTGAIGGAQQGSAVAVSGDGNTMVVGGPLDNSSAGAVWVWTRSGGVWSQQGSKLVGTGAVGAAQQGYSVALSADGNTAVVGGYSDNVSAGAAWVWTRSGGVWSQQGTKLVGTGAVGAARQGFCVGLSADGNTAVVGGWGDNGLAGAAWVWTRSGGVWSQQGTKLVGTGASGNASQGVSVALSGDGNTVLVGGYSDNNSAGAAWVWTRSGGVWSQQGSKLVGTGAVGAASQAFSVALSGDGNTAVVGGYADNGFAGATWMWKRAAGVWSQRGSKLVGTGAAGNAQQGYSVALSGDGYTAVVGAPNDNSGFGIGAAWVFVDPTPKIVSVHDVPNDQGGKVHVLWNASILDAAPSYGISSYTLWRRISAASAAQAAERGVQFLKTGASAESRSNGAGPGAIRVTTEGTQSLYWEFVESVPARGVSGYGYMAPTTSDSLPPGAISSQQGPKLVGVGAVGAAQQGRSVAVSADGNTAIVGGPSDNGSVGAAWVWTRSGAVWSQQGTKLVGTGAVGASQQGSSLALSADGNTAVVGGWNDNTNAGAAWVWTRSGGVWSQQGAKLVGTGAVGVAQQGISVALSADGNTAIVGGYADNGAAGAAWVWTRSGGVWSQQGSKLVGTGAAGAAHQGSSAAVSADGNTAVVGGWGDNGNAGAAWVWTRSGGVWSQQGSKLVGTAALGAAQQGNSVAVSADGNTAVVGGPGDNGGQGASWVWTRSGGVWNQQGTKLVGTGVVNVASQGYSVAVSADGNTAVIGGPTDDFTFAGATWVWSRSGGVWSQHGGKLVGADAVGAAGQGISVALSADARTAIVGGYTDNSNAGAAWVFTPGLPWNVFFVDAKDATTSAFYVSAPDSGYSVDNLPPGPPAPLTAAYSGGATYLHWGVNLEPDFSMYRVYRGNSAGFVPGAGNLLTTEPDTGYVDVGAAGSYYKVSAVDDNGNESSFALVSPTQTSGVSGSGLFAFGLEGVRQNPASGRDLMVHFVLPIVAAARVELIDVAGRTVVAREVGALGPGPHAVNLAERERMRPGLYFIRLKQGTNEKVARVTVLQ